MDAERKQRYKDTINEKWVLREDEKTQIMKDYYEINGIDPATIEIKDYKLKDCVPTRGKGRPKKDSESIDSKEM